MAIMPQCFFMTLYIAAPDTSTIFLHLIRDIYISDIMLITLGTKYIFDILFVSCFLYPAKNIQDIQKKHIYLALTKYTFS